MAAEAFAGAGGVLRDLRRTRGWSQSELADQAGRGASRRAISMVESGNPASASFIAAVSTALEVDPIVFISSGQQAAPLLGKVEMALPEIRRCLATYDCPPEPAGPSRELNEIAADVERACALRLGARYGQLAGLIVPVVDELTVLAHSLQGRERERAFGLLAMAYRCMDALVYKSGHPDISAIATERMVWAAERSADQLMIATGGYVRAQAFFDLGPAALEQGLRFIVRTAAPLEAMVGANRQAAGVFTALHARAGVLAARAGQSTAATAHLASARETAGLLGKDATVYGTYVGPDGIRISTFTAFVEMGDGAAAIEAASGLQPTSGTPDERSSHALIDLARALTWERQLQRALDCLVTARSLAPQHTRMHPLVAPTLEQIRTRLSRRSERAEALAAWIGLPPR